MGVWCGSGRLCLHGSVAGRNKFRFLLVVWGKFVVEEVVTQGESIAVPINPKIPSLLGVKKKPWECIHSGRVALPVVLPKVHHCPEPLYVPTEVNTLQLDGLARIPVLTQALHIRILSHRIASLDPARLIPLSTNTQCSLVPQVPTLKEVRVRERGRG